MQKIILIFITFFIASCGPLSIIGATKAIITTDLDRRTVGAITDDNLIDLDLEAWAVGDKQLENSHLNFNLYNKNLLITGEIESASIAKYVVNYVKTNTTVKRIFNEMKVAPTSSLFARTADSLIDGKIKLALNNQEVFNPVHINYHTENKVVYLMGDVTKREAKKAGIMVAGVDGVRRVVKYFNYIKNIPQREINRAKSRENDKIKQAKQQEKDFIKQQKIKKLQQQIDAIRKE